MSGHGGPAARRVVIALGGNMGDRVETLRRAMLAIDELDGVQLTTASSLYETPAMTLEGVDESAPRYLNAVVIVVTQRGPEDLLLELHRIEERFGRQRVERWGSRTLDLDIVDVDGLQLSTESITLPHPNAWQRAFVLAPWYEIDPAAHLVGHGAIADLLSMASDRVEMFAESGLDGRSPTDVSTDRGLPIIGPDSMAEAPRPIRGGESGFGADVAERYPGGTGTGSPGSTGWQSRSGGSGTQFGADHDSDDTPPSDT